MKIICKSCGQQINTETMRCDPCFNVKPQQRDSRYRKRLENDVNFNRADPAETLHNMRGIRRTGHQVDEGTSPVVEDDNSG